MAALEQYCQIIISVAMIFVVSRLLNSEAIGVAVIGLGLGAVVFTIREFVTSEFLIQRVNITTQSVRTGTTLVLSLSLAIAALLCLAAPFIAAIYNEPRLQAFVYLIAVAGVIEALALPASALMRRDMQFGIVTRINAGTAIIYATVTISCAALGLGFMSFAWGTLGAALMRTALSFHARPQLWMFRPCLRGTREIVAFGGYKGASSVLDRFYEALPQLVLGYIMPMSAVGVFNRANIVCGLPDKFLLSAIFAVAFPAFSLEVRHERSLKAPYLRLLGYISVLFMPATGMLAILAHPVVRVSLGGDWLAVVPVLQILAVAALFSFPCILTFPVLAALGANRDACAANFIGRGLSTVVICAASYHGLIALALSQFVTLPFQAYVSLRFVRRNVPFAWSELWSVLGRSAVVTACSMAGPMMVLGLNAFDGDLSVVQTLSCCLLAAAGWMGGVIAVSHPILDELPRLIGRSLPGFGSIRFWAAPR
ncbi:oligosaccharide flippase family protein [Rhizobium sp. Root482]|uniref:oligosaccharide flippase family protein n=1 Tax=Rhizobium sp. Root482 TaxID=1736543 RepID=UPI00138F159B|nr:oligosaccharide flippase family protein [Rhizobium sp. Root482]